MRRTSGFPSVLSATVCSFALVLLLSHVIEPAAATRDTWDDDFDDNLYWIDRFAFKEDGTWNVQIDPVQKGVPLRMLVCRDSDYSDTVKGYDTSDGVNVCNKIAKNDTRCSVFSFKGFGNFTGAARARDMYWFVLVNCNRTSLDVEFYEIFENPDDEYLGWDHLPLPYLYAILIIIYTALLIVWLSNIAMIDMGAGSNRLHKYISLWPIMKLFIVIFNTAYWAYLSRRGVMQWGVRVIYIIYNSFWYAYLFGALLLIGLAWGISRKGMNWIEVFFFTLVQIILYITWVINFALEGYYFVASVFGLGCMLAVIFFFTSFSLRTVSHAIKKSQSVGPDAPQSDGLTSPKLPEGNTPGAELNDVRYQQSKLNLQERYRVLKLFMVLHIAYILPMIAWAIIIAWRFHYHAWAYRMLNEGTELLLVLILGWILRLRRRNIYFEFNDEALIDWENRGAPAGSAQSTNSDGHGIEMDALPQAHRDDSSTFHNPYTLPDDEEELAPITYAPQPHVAKETRPSQDNPSLSPMTFADDTTRRW